MWMPFVNRDSGSDMASFVNVVFLGLGIVLRKWVKNESPGHSPKG